MAPDTIETPSGMMKPNGSWFRDYAERLALGALLVVLMFYSILFLYHAARLALYPYQIDYGEGFILSHAMKLAAFENPYQPIGDGRWIVVHYPPVYPALAAIGVKLFGPQFHFGRFLSVFSILVAGYALLRMLRWQTNDRAAAWIGALLWVSAYPVYNWGTHHRVDSVGLALEALGLMFLLERSHLKTSAFFFLAALFTRQTLWVGPFAGYFFLRRYSSPRLAANWMGGLLLSGALVFGALTLATGGEFLRHIVLYNANQFNWKDVWVMLHNAVMQMMKLQMAFLLYYLLRAFMTRQWDLAAWCIPFSILTFCMVGKIGAATNYLFELTFVSCWAVGLGLAESRTLLPNLHPMRMLLPLVLFLGTLFPLHIPHFYGEYKIYDWGGTPDADSALLTEVLVDRLAHVPGPVFSQDAGASLLAGHELVWDPFLMRQLEDANRIDTGPFLEMIRQKKFGAIVLPFDLDAESKAWQDGGWWTQFSEKTANAIHQFYRVVPPAPLSADPDSPRMRGYYSPFGTNYLYLPR